MKKILLGVLSTLVLSACSDTVPTVGLLRSLDKDAQILFSNFNPSTNPTNTFSSTTVTILNPESFEYILWMQVLGNLDCRQQDYSTAIKIAPTDPMTFTPSIEGSFKICAIGKIALLNIEQTAAEASESPLLVVDQTPPQSVGLNINSGASSTNSLAVTLNLSAIGASEFYATQDASCSTGGSWNSFTSPNANFNLTLPNQMNTVYVTYRDAAANVSACVSASITHDDSLPNIISFVPLTSPTNTSPIIFQLVFDSDVTFDNPAAAITAANGTVSSFTGFGSNYTFHITPTSEGTVVATLNVGTYRDSSGNTNSSSTSTTAVYDLTPPQFTLIRSAGQQLATNDPNLSFDLNTTEAINFSSLSGGDITQQGTASVSSWSVTQVSPTQYTLTATASSNGTIIPHIDVSMVSDLAGNSNTLPSSGSDRTVTYDNQGPQLTYEKAAAQLDPTSSLPVRFKLDSNEEIDPSSFSPSDITQLGTAPDVVWVIEPSADNKTWYFKATSTSGVGTIKPLIPVGSMTDFIGNPNTTAVPLGDVEIEYDNESPSLTINQASGQNDPVNTLPIEFTILASEPLDPASFDFTDITQAGTAAGITWSLTTSDNITWTLRATAILTPGTVVPTIAANKVTDNVGNNNTSSTATDNSVKYDITSPTVTINQSTSSPTQADPTNSLPVTFKIVSSEIIKTGTFTTGDITQAGTATGVTWSLNTADNITWTLTATAVTTAGTIMPSIAAAKFTDEAGNNNSASSSTDNNVTYDNVAPVLLSLEQSTSAPTQVDPTNSLPIAFKAVFSEPILPASFTVSDISQSGTASGITWSRSTVDNITWTIAATAVSSPGTVVPTIAGGVITDNAGNLNLAASPVNDNSVTYDNVAPTLTINKQGGQLSPTNTQPINFTITASEPLDPASFTTTDIIQDGTATGITWSLSTSDNITWTLTASGLSANGTVIPNINTTSVRDVAGNFNSVPALNVLGEVIYDNQAPTVTITRKSSQDDPTNDLPIDFDLVFSEPINHFTFDNSDLQNSGSATGITWSLSSGDNQNYQLRVVSASGSGSITPFLAGARVTDLAGNSNAASTTPSGGDPTVDYDITPPSIFISSVSPQIGGNLTHFIFSVDYSGADNIDLSTSDITLNGANTSGCSYIIGNNEPSDKTFRTVIVSGCTASSASMSITIAGDTAQDLVGNSAPAVSSPSVNLDQDVYYVGFTKNNLIINEGTNSSTTTVIEAKATNAPISSSINASIGLNSLLKTALAGTHYVDPMISNLSLPATSSIGTFDFISKKDFDPNLSTYLQFEIKDFSSTLRVEPNSSIVQKILIADDDATDGSSNNLKRYKALSAGANHICAINSIDKLFCWGNNISYQLTNTSDHPQQLSPANVDDGYLSRYTKVAGGRNHTCAITDDGFGGTAVECWGNNASGQIGNNNIGTSVQSPTSIASSIAYINPITDIATGDDFSCYVKGNSIYCFGENSDAQLARGNTTDSGTPQIVDSGTNYLTVSAGRFHACGITTSNNLKCWGRNDLGQLGNNAGTSNVPPTAVTSPSSFLKISLGALHTCGIGMDTKLYCWGDNSQGQVGVGSTSFYTTPQLIDGGISYVEVEAGANHTCGITSSNILKCWGRNTDGQLGHGHYQQISVPSIVQQYESFVKVSAGDTFTCAMNSSNQIKCWGNNYYGQIGDGKRSVTSSPEVMSSNPTSILDLSLGLENGCYVDGSGTLKCWGHGSHAGNAVKTLAIPFTADRGVSYLKVGSGNKFSCGLTSSYTVKCWGYSPYTNTGQIIDSGTRFSDISVGYNHACGIRFADQKVKCWGYNDSYQLGDGTTNNTFTSAVYVNGFMQFIKISAGTQQTCGVTADSALWCWGKDGTGTTYTSPRLLDSGIAYRDVSVGSNHACAITTLNRIKCYGNNARRQLGQANESPSNSMVEVTALSDVGDVSAGSYFTCARLNTGQVFCWGENGMGQLANNSISYTEVPTTVTFPTFGSLKLKAGQTSTCSQQSDNKIYCWGNRSFGVTGGGYITSIPTPLVQ